MEVKKIPNSVWSFLWHYLSAQRILFFSIVATIVLSELLMRVSLYFAAQIVEAISSSQATKANLMFGVLSAFWASLALLLKSLVQNGTVFVEARFMPNCIVRISKDLFAYVHQHSTAFFAEEMAGNISGKVKTIIDSIYPAFYNLLWGFFSPLVAMVITFFFIFKINFQLSLLLISLNLFLIYIIYKLSKTVVPVSEKRAKTMSEANGVLVDSITNAGIVKNFSRYYFEKKYYFRYMRIAAEADRAETKKFGMVFIWQNLLRSALQILFYLLPIWYWYIGEINVSDFVLIQSLIAILNNTFNMLSMNFMQFFKLYGSLRDGLALLSKPCDVVDCPRAQKLKVSAGEIVFDNICYHYKHTNPLFEDFSLLIHSGEKVGLVGHSGSGKSTLVRLLSRYYDIQKGTISIDGQNIAKVRQDSIRQQIALIPQEPGLFNRSIMDNIRYGKPDASDEDVYKAAKMARIHDFIIGLPKGYETAVGERGLMLSGGQRQRIAIARAILKDAPILILDEATSALDSESEKYIQDSLKELMRGKTVIAIAHRLSTLKEMDRIVVMDNGKIVESGTHSELLAKQGTYYGFYKMQSSGFMDSDSTNIN